MAQMPALGLRAWLIVHAVGRQVRQRRAPTPQSALISPQSAARYPPPPCPPGGRAGESREGQGPVRTGGASPGSPGTDNTAENNNAL